METGSLDEVAARLASATFATEGLARTMAKWTDRLDRLPPAIARVARPLISTSVVIAALPSGLLQARRRTKTVRLYVLATYADEDRARADIAAVAKRLIPFNPGSAALVNDAARWLVRWVAAGSPARGQAHAAMEQLGHQVRDLLESLPSGSGRPGSEPVWKTASRLVRLNERYEESWRRLLREAPQPPT